MVIILIIYSVGVFINIHLQTEIQNSIKKTVQSRATYLSAELNGNLKNIKNEIIFTATRSNVVKLTLYNQNSSISDMIDDIRAVRQFLTSISSSSNLVTQVSVFYPQIGRSISSNYMYVKLSNDDYDLMKYFYSGRQNNNLVIWKGNIYLISSVYSANHSTQEYPAALVVQLSSDGLRTAITSAATSKDFQIFLSVNNELMLHDNSSQQSVLESTKLLSYAKQIALADHLAENQYFRVDNKKYWVLSTKTQDYSLSILSFTDINALTGNVNQFQLWSILFTIISGLAIIGFLLIVNNVITRPIHKITNAIEILEHDGILEFENTKDEMDSLYKAFSKVTERLKATLDQVYNNKLIAQRAEIKYLQSQINPHFLYNSFFHLYQMSKMEDIEGVAQMCNKLGKYYQNITRCTSATIPLELEYVNARDYTDIQTIRFGNRIAVQFTPLHDDFREFLVPRFILQPILENAYNHGMDKHVSAGMIQVDVALIQQELTITVEDNGAVMDDSDIKRLSAYLMDINSDLEITGLRNVKYRMIMYGGDLLVAKSELGGLKVLLTIPTSKVG